MQQRCAMMGEVVRTSQNRASELEETGVKLASRALQLKHQLYKQKGSMSPDPARVRAMLVKGDDIDTWDGDIWYDDDDRYPDQPSYPPFPGPGSGEDTAQAQARPAMVTTYTYPTPQGEAEGNDFDSDYAQAEGDARVRPGEALNAGRRQVQYKDYTMKELSGMGQRFRQKPSEPLTAWLLRIWGRGAPRWSACFPLMVTRPALTWRKTRKKKMVSVVGQQDFDDALIRPTPGYPICGTVTAIWLTQSPTCTM
ncbi:uncharacterized protein [Hemitrygon akajei]|uniref:uncharacterized protein n=1 Tax=Hemitrygon akajei TaxID=2704970 RepID=UPI003BF945EE